MEIEAEIKAKIENTLSALGISGVSILLEHPTERVHGDFSCNVAMIIAKQHGANPRELADSIVAELLAETDSNISKIEVAGPGFINFYLSPVFFAQSIRHVLALGDAWGKNAMNEGKKIMVEYTDPNPFKAFHIGHLMNNAIGESIARLLVYSGALVKRANYQGDVGPHVAKALWGIKHGHGSIDSADGLGKAYAAGAQAYEKDEQAKAEIIEINKAVYEGSDSEISALYERGRQVSLDHFEELYKIVGSKFDYYFFESQVWNDGVEIVKRNVGSVFEESEGAIVFKGDKYDKKLHTRVFINSEGLPTYEAKEIGLAYKKKETYDADVSIYITAIEQADYFKVVKRAIEEIDKEMAERIVHLTHGLMKLPSGKMSSRTGDVVTGESLIEEVKKAVLAIESEREIGDKEKTAEWIAIAALKYLILKQHASKDTIYDLEKTVSFEGDSGPYLQYAYTRANTLLDKANAQSISDVQMTSSDTSDLEKLLYRFPELVGKAIKEYAPHHVTQYLTELAGSFNSFYAQEKIIGSDNEQYKLSLIRAFKITMRNGLYVLGIKVPEKM